MEAQTDQSRESPSKNTIQKFPSISLAISLSAILLIFVHLLWPQVVVDTITMGLVVLAALPWLATLLKSAEFPGGWKFEFREVQKKVDRQGDEINYLKFLFTNFLTDWEVTHLTKFVSDQPFTFNKSNSFDQELRRLRALGFIEPLDDKKGIGSMNSEQNGDVKHHFRITSQGRKYLKMREDLNIPMAG